MFAFPASESPQSLPSQSTFDLFNRNARAGTVILPADANLVDTFSRMHGATTPKQKAEAYKDGGCHWKEVIGPDSDISDRRLSTPPRLRTNNLDEYATTVRGSA